MSWLSFFLGMAAGAVLMFWIAAIAALVVLVITHGPNEQEDDW